MLIQIFNTLIFLNEQKKKKHTFFGTTNVGDSGFNRFEIIHFSNKI